MDNHQYFNAKQELSDSVQLIEEKDLNEEILLSKITNLLKLEPSSCELEVNEIGIIPRQKRYLMN